MLYNEKGRKVKIETNTVDWKIDKEYIKEHIGYDGSENQCYREWKEKVIITLDQEFGSIEKDIDYYGKSMTRFTIPNRILVTSKEIVEKNIAVDVMCPFCKLVGMPHIHSAGMVKFYRGVDGKLTPGKCKYFHKIETRLREKPHFDGQIGDFSERIVIEAYKHEVLYVPSKAFIVKEFYSKTDKCYITGVIAVDPEKEHFWASSLGNPYIIYHRDGTYENNIMKASRTPNQSKRATTPEEFLSAERYEAAIKSNNIKKIPETFEDGRNVYSVELVRKHLDVLIKYVEEERQKQEVKIRWIENFIR